ncbi:hypothetical protein ACSD8G_000328 [Campylobacter coli]|nr:hypothetical protein [Campylobacter coli]
MKIIKYGNDVGIVFDNGNSLWDTYIVFGSVALMALSIYADRKEKK